MKKGFQIVYYVHGERHVSICSYPTLAEAKAALAGYVGFAAHVEEIL